MDTLEDSRLEFMRKSHELGKQLAKEWLDHVDDYGLLTRIAHGHPLVEVPELVREEIYRPELIEDFGGVADMASVLDGLNDGLQECKDYILHDLL